MSTPVLVFEAASVPVLVFDEPATPVVVVSPAPFVGTGVVVQSPPLTRLTVDASTSSATFVELLFTTITMTVGSRLRVTTTICGKAVAGSQDGHITAFLTPQGGSLTQGANASCFRAGSTSAQGTAVVNEFGNVPAGTHRVALHWFCSSGGSIEVEAASRPDRESAVLVVEELV